MAVKGQSRTYRLSHQLLGHMGQRGPIIQQPPRAVDWRTEKVSNAILTLRVGYIPL